ncbi:alpha/beta hydrolase [Alloscardovia omnicolens]|uniref:alpha/beta hydrolase n=1 Tax=Alloscardovia omnicolens TaxID=419015 RepID=UPI003A6A646B
MVKNSVQGPGASDNTSASAIIDQAVALGDWREAGYLWSFMDEDFQGEGTEHISQKAKRTALAMREGSARTDYPRITAWQLPQDVIAHLAIPYSEDNDRGHYLDVFVPADAGKKHSYPVVIDDHGGGFVYGMRELNRSFAMHLAHRGYVVVLPSYLPAPRCTFVDMLTDLSAAYSWTLDNIARYGGDTSKLFLTGDSAGACMALHSAQIENSAAMSERTGVAQAGLDIKGLLLVCGIYNLSECFNPESDAGNLQGICPEVFESVRDNFAGYDNTKDLLAAAPLPPVFINTSSDDFLHDENLDLAARLEALGVQFELDDADAKEWGELGHVSVIGLSTHERSQISLDRMDAFMQRVLNTSTL